VPVTWTSKRFLFLQSTASIWNALLCTIDSRNFYSTMEHSFVGAIPRGHLALCLHNKLLRPAHRRRKTVMQISIESAVCVPITVSSAQYGQSLRTLWSVFLRIMISFAAQYGASLHCDLPFFMLWWVFLYSTMFLNIIISPSVSSHYISQT
jgi:hypothetical protein